MSKRTAFEDVNRVEGKAPDEAVYSSYHSEVAACLRCGAKCEVSWDKILQYGILDITGVVVKLGCPVCSSTCFQLVKLKHELSPLLTEHIQWRSSL